MNKYPLDFQGVLDITHVIIQHNEAQEVLIDKLFGFLREAMTYVPEDDSNGEWCQEVESTIQEMHQRKIDFANLRFSQKPENGGHRPDEISPYTGPMDIVDETKLNAAESDFGPPMSEEELAAYFNEPLPKKAPKEPVQKSLSKMSLEEIETWEKAQDNSTDIYKIAARVKNLARVDGQAALMPAGEMLCNQYTHVLKSFYDFANTIADPELKIRLCKLIQKHEDMPGKLIEAGVGTKGTRGQ